MRILWLDQAKTDVDELLDYLLDRNPQAAYGVYAAIQQHVAQLADHPGLGRAGRVAGTRELVIPRARYIVAYTFDPHVDAVIILRVLHGARRWPEHL